MTNRIRYIPPGAVVGVLGGGQLGRMFVLAAHRLGYRVHVFSPGRGSPAGQVAEVEVAAPYDDLEAVARFARRVAAVACEFENVPASALAAAASVTQVCPDPVILSVAQNRAREKEFLVAHGFPLVPYRVIGAATDLATAFAALGGPAVLKRASGGYDGIGQARVHRSAELEPAYHRLGGSRQVLERWVEAERELSVIVARADDGSLTDWGVVENFHRRQVLDWSLAPAGVTDAAAAAARALAHAVAEALDLVGILCVELFQLSDGRLLVNELAPRPHNSGHFTLEASLTSQFEQQVRILCGLPLGDTTVRSAAAMANLLGELWGKGEPDWRTLGAFPEVKLHLYGKREARPGRKLGHLTALAARPERALARVLAARAALAPRSETEPDADHAAVPFQTRRLAGALP